MTETRLNVFRNWTGTKRKNENTEEREKSISFVDRPRSERGSKELGDIRLKVKGDRGRGGVRGLERRERSWR